MSDKPASPPLSALVAFGTEGAAIPFAMGQGDAFAAGDVVLKRVDDEGMAAWIADFAAAVTQDGFRLARPIAARDGRWVVDGWSAWTRVPGEHSSTRWAELLEAAAAFHHAISDEPKPEWIDRRTNRWRVADRLAWGDESADDLLQRRHLAPLVAARRPVHLRSQLIHADLAGNVLFEEGQPPAIIDLSLYWRPVGYSAAILVSDALTWEGASRDILDLVDRQEQWPQLFLRAVLFRIVVNELAWRQEPERAERSGAYDRIVDLVLSLVDRD